VVREARDDGIGEVGRTVRETMGSGWTSRVSAAGPTTRRKPEKLGLCVAAEAATVFIVATADIVARATF